MRFNPEQGPAQYKTNPISVPLQPGISSRFIFLKINLPYKQDGLVPFLSRSDEPGSRLIVKSLIYWRQADFFISFFS